VQGARPAAGGTHLIAALRFTYVIFFVRAQSGIQLGVILQPNVNKSLNAE
jgi:hypothetical protein